jgi:hypothetical protein
MKLNLNWKKIDRATIKAFKDTNLLAGRRFTQAISSPTWEYPIDPSPRDIVDTGRLRASQQLNFSPRGTEAIHSWPTDYALYVHEGYTTRKGSQIPARRWTEKGLESIQNDFDILLQKELEKE